MSPNTQAVTIAEVGSLQVERFEEVLAEDSYDIVREALGRARNELDGRAIWNVNSTRRGGGVAEMLEWLLAYARGAGVDAQWAVIGGDPDFFRVTKRIHHRLHGFNGDGLLLGQAERGPYEAALAAAGAELQGLIHEGDIVLLHDPQTAGLIPHLIGRGFPVIWRCHVGADRHNERVENAWDFLRPYVQQADAVVFSRHKYVWDGLDPDKVHLVAPTIDAFGPKNQDLDAVTVAAILEATGIRAPDRRSSDGSPPAEPDFLRMDGTPGRVANTAQAHEVAPLNPGERFVLQVSRWDGLKDPLGVIRGFAEHVAPHTDAHLLHAGPDVTAVSDDPEGEAVLEECRQAWEELPDDIRARVHLVLLPMDDPDENAAIVNALQRAATIVVQKSLAEGFGLTVAEAMWKGRPVVASAVGGINDQIEDGVNGVLLQDPTDLEAYGTAVRELLEDEDRAAELGKNARERVRANFLGTRSLLAYLALFERLLQLDPGASRQPG